MEIMSVKSVAHPDQLDADALRALAQQLMGELDETRQVVAKQAHDIHFKGTHIRKLTHEIAVLRRYRFGKKSEQLGGEQGLLLEDAVDADIAAIAQELINLGGPQPKQKTVSQPKRQALPPELPRVQIHHEPHSTTCPCGCQMQRIGEAITEKLDYIPGVFSVEQHIRGKWACRQCETLTQAPMPAQVIDKGIATSGLLTHVLVAKYADHLPLYRQEQIYARAGVKIPRSTLAEWVGVCGVRLQPLVDALREVILNAPVVHADETPVQVLQPGSKKTHRAYLWAYAPGAFQDLKAVVYDFTEGRSGAHARAFLGDWRGVLVCDDYSGYKAGFAQGIAEAGCMAHARRKFYELHKSGKSQIAEQALKTIGQLYEIEALSAGMSPDERQRLREQQARPIAEALHAWMTAHRIKVPEGTDIARVLDYSLKRWAALTRYLDDGRLPIDNNHIENQIRPIALGRKNWLFAGSLRAGRRAAAAMSLIQSAKMNGHDPYAYLKDVLTRLPTHPNSRIEELLPHRWRPDTA
ncbi:transposase [Paracandidimonas soli]|uniref:Transposase n=2 Tax=Paracandidimonas soli TaxID=1917182 RepID=A0A4R3V575_9BURK|nr:transposase [Paracandidimonas soli]